MNLQIKGFIKTSLLDWEGMIVSTLYTPYCNFRCPYCQNSVLILHPEQLPTHSFDEITGYLSRHKGWVDGICLTGGEPCIYAGLPLFLKKIRSPEVKIKLDTNGSFPGMLERVLKRGIVDYIAMDIKAPLEQKQYEKATGVKVNLEKIKESIRIIRESGIDYEFRTTVVPGLHTADSLTEIAKFIKGAKKYALQNFVPQETLDPEYLKLKPYSLEELQKMAEGLSKYLDKCVVRGG